MSVHALAVGPETTQDVISRAREAMAEDRPDDAVRTLSALLERSHLAVRTRVEATLLVASCELAQGRARRAQDALVDALRLTGPLLVPAQRTSAGAAVVQPLTAKELEVLGYLAALLSTEEVARTMFVSVNTVKSHVRGILRKLSVERRNQAVRRAYELGLIR